MVNTWSDGDSWGFEQWWDEDYEGQWGLGEWDALQQEQPAPAAWGVDERGPGWPDPDPDQWDRPDEGAWDRVLYHTGDENAEENPDRGGV